MRTSHIGQPLLVVLGLLGIYLALQWLSARPTTPGLRLTKPHQRQPFGVDFSLPNLHGDTVRLADFRGHVILVNFWATWCHPCRTEMPAMQALYQAYQTKGFTIIAVASDTKGYDTVAPFTDDYHLTFPILLDPQNTIGTQLHLRGIPTTFLLDKHGRIAWIAVGARDWNSPSFRNALDAMLAEAPPPHAS